MGSTSYWYSLRAEGLQRAPLCKSAVSSLDQDARETDSSGTSTPPVSTGASGASNGHSAGRRPSSLLPSVDTDEAAGAAEGWGWDGSEGIEGDETTPSPGVGHAINGAVATAPLRTAQLAVPSGGAVTGGGGGGSGKGTAADVARRREELQKRRDARR